MSIYIALVIDRQSEHPELLSGLLSPRFLLLIPKCVPRALNLLIPLVTRPPKSPSAPSTIRLLTPRLIKRRTKCGPSSA